LAYALAGSPPGAQGDGDPLDICVSTDLYRGGSRRAGHRLSLPTDGNPASGPKFDHKLAWFERLHKYGKTLIAADAPFIMAGDSNVMPTYLDVDAPERWRDDALFRPEVRNAYAELVTLGWQMRCVTSIPASAFTPSGSISGRPSPAMPGRASITCC
jgi:hypothetical protein